MTSTLHAIQHDSQLGQWEYVFGTPRPSLAAYVHHYQGYIERHTGFQRRREYPRPNSSIILNLGTPLRVANPVTGEQTDQAKSFVAGISDYYVTTESLGLSYGIEISFTPLGVHMFLGVATDVFADRIYSLSDVLGPAADHLTEQVACASDWQTRFDLIDAFIAERFASACLPSRQVEGAYTALQRSGGLYSVASLARAAGWSEKHLVDRFREQVGLTPKTMGRIIRFNRALRLLDAANQPALADVAFEAGYYDQPHMNRDFRRFTGSPPTEFLKRQLPGGAGLRDA